jgi:hypothetical protein
VGVAIKARIASTSFPLEKTTCSPFSRFSCRVYGAGRFYSEEKLLALIAERAPSASALLDRVEAAVAAHSSGAERSDDITMLAVRRTG